MVWNDTHLATRCCNVDAPDLDFDLPNQGLKSASEILGAGAVACYAIGNKNPRFSYPTCTYHCMNEPGAIRQLQKYCHLKLLCLYIFLLQFIVLKIIKEPTCFKLFKINIILIPCGRYCTIF